MKNIALKKEPAKVSNIADNSRFQPVKNKTLISRLNLEKNIKYSIFVLSESCFGFARGDELICRKWDQPEIQPNAIVVEEVKGKRRITTAADAKSIFAVVVAFQREVFHDAK